MYVFTIHHSTGKTTAIRKRENNGEVFSVADFLVDVD